MYLRRVYWERLLSLSNTTLTLNDYSPHVITREYISACVNSDFRRLPKYVCMPHFHVPMKNTSQDKYSKSWVMCQFSSPAFFIFTSNENYIMFSTTFSTTIQQIANFIFQLRAKRKYLIKVFIWWLFIWCKSNK